MSLKKYPPDFEGLSAFFGINRHLNGIESTGFIYVPGFEDSRILRASSMRLCGNNVSKGVLEARPMHPVP